MDDTARWPSARVSRRRFIVSATTVAAAGATFGLAACGGDGGDEAARRTGGALRFGTTLRLSYGLDPHLEQGAGLAMFPKVYGYMLHVDSRDESLVLDHASSVEQPDETTYIFRLAPRRFHPLPPADGRSVVGDDVVQSVRRYRENELVLSKFAHTKIVNAEAAPNPSAVLVTTARPYAGTLAEICGINAGAILPAEVESQMVDLRNGGAGSGPFRFDTVTDDAIAVARFEGYGGEAALVDAMEWRLFADRPTLLEALGAREIDVVTGAGRKDGLEAGGATVVAEPSLSTLSIGLRVDDPPFNDERVRRALDFAIDRRALMRAAGAPEASIVGPINSHLAGGFWSLTRDEIIESQGGGLDEDERRSEVASLLEAAGHPRVEFVLQSSDDPEVGDVAELLRQALRSFGFDITVERWPPITWYGRLQQGAFQATLMAQAPHETPDGGARFYHSRGPDGDGSSFAYDNADVDALIERSWAEFDRESRRDLLRDAQRLMIQDRPLIHLFSGIGYSAAHDYVRDSGLELPGSLQRAHYRQWLALPADGRPN